MKHSAFAARDLFFGTRRLPISQLTYGVAAKIVGRLQCEQELVAPISGIRCAVWDVRVIQAGQLIKHESAAGDFVVVDPTGRLQVDASSFELYDHAATTYTEQRWLSSLCEAAIAYLRDEGIAPRYGLSVAERRVCNGQPIAVYGMKEYRASTESTNGFRQPAAQDVLAGRPLLITSDTILHR